MLKITSDGDHIASVSLVNDKLEVKDATPMGEKVVSSMRNMDGYPLTDEEAYKMMPHRLTGRVAASFDKADASLADPAEFERIMDELRSGKRTRLPPPKPQRGTAPKSRDSQQDSDA